MREELFVETSLLNLVNSSRPQATGFMQFLFTQGAYNLLVLQSVVCQSASYMDKDNKTLIIKILAKY
jgi:hypothetical protein